MLILFVGVVCYVSFGQDITSSEQAPGYNRAKRKRSALRELPESTPKSLEVEEEEMYHLIESEEDYYEKRMLKSKSCKGCPPSSSSLSSSCLSSSPN